MIVEPQEESVEFSSLEAREEPQQEERKEAPQVEELPERYRGKTAAELVRMHEEAQKFISRQANEVSEVRKLADDLIKQQLSKKAEQPSPVVEEPDVDFFENPQEAVKRTLRDSPEMKELREMKRQAKAQQTAALLAQNHPDAFEIARSSDFADWVKASKVRLSLYAQADGDYDFDAANELILSYKAQKQISSRAVESTTVSQKKALNAATVDTNGSSEGRSQKIYRRADIMKLMQTDPDRYQLMQPEIMLAYAEKRVR